METPHELQENVEITRKRKPKLAAKVIAIVLAVALVGASLVAAVALVV